MSSPPSSARSDLTTSTLKGEDDSGRDIPVFVNRFLRHVRLLRILLGLSLLLATGLEVALAIDWIKHERDPVHQSMKDLSAWVGWTDFAGTLVIVICLSIYILSSVRPVRSTVTGDTLPNLGLHRVLCQSIFLLSALNLLMHATPGIVYTATTYRAAPDSHSAPELVTARTVALVCTFLSSGLMQRGPLRHYTPIDLGTGFGINAATNVVPGGKAIKGSVKPGDSDIEVQPKFDAGGDKDNVLEYGSTSMLSFIFLIYMAKLLRTSMHKDQLQPNDLPYLEESIRNAGADQDLRIRVQDDAKGIRLPVGDGKITKWMLVKHLWRGRGMTVFITFCVETIVTLFGYLQIYSMHEIILAFDRAPEEGHDRAYARLMCWGLFVGQTVTSILSAYSSARENYLIHTPVRMSLASLLFRKILRTTDVRSVEAHNLTEAETQAGKGRSQIINLLTIDSGSMASLATHVWNATNAIVALAIGVVFLYQMFGVSALIGIASFLLSAPISVFISRSSYVADRAWARYRDARASALKEFLLCYKVIKLNAFEPYFRRRIERLRDVEVVWQRWRYTLGTSFNILADELPSVAILVIFFFHTKVFGHRLEPASAFVALSVFSKVKSGLQFIPQFIQTLSNTLVAINRLVAFLNRPEVDLDEWSENETEIVFERASFSWPVADTDEKDPKAFKLMNIDFRVPNGKVSLVCGPLGAGKSLLLRSMLGETNLLSGSLRSPRTHLDATPINGYSIVGPWTTETWLNDSVSYAPQQAYIRHGTIRDNILSGQPMWRSRYKEALREASLLSDLALLSDGDLTEVGDHGVTLSGGQKARVNLARCIYSRSRFVYLDDILSAVDAHTAQFIVEQCFSGPLLKDRTVVLVSHHVTLCLPVVDFVISLKEGRIEQACSISEAQTESLQELQHQSPMSGLLSPIIEQQLLVQSPPDEDLLNDGTGAEDDRAARQVYKSEVSAIGRVSSNHYMLVFTAAGGLFYWSIFAIVFGLAVVLSEIMVPLLYRHWSGDTDPAHLNTDLLIYLGLTTAGVFAGGARWIWLYGVGNVGFYNRGSRAIHATLLNFICTAPLSFFEETPKGRLMNIFGQDMWRLDANSADDFGRTLMAALDVGASALMVCSQVPALLSILVIFGVPLYWLSNVLGKLRADLRRVTNVATSPLVTLYNDTIEGIVMIRAFGSSKLMISTMQVLINRERVAWVSDFLVYNWVRGLIRAMASVFVTATGFVLLGTNLTGPQAGFILVFAVNASQGLFNLLECYSNLEQTFVSAERINHYITMDMAEPPTGVVPEKSWPDRGSIKFRDISVRYAEDLPEVLHKVSFDVEPGMRVGLVGATGSGKSTLALTIFRAIEPHNGSIEIDGLDISQVKLDELRSRLNMVVQDGTLCSGTLRDALDITGSIDDHEIYEALRRVHLIPDNATAEELKHNPFANLDTFVAVEGANFSHGQRQLLCLARALLKPGKILVMDEATSSVDFEMDALITETIKECFKGTTMLVIAHRLATIMHYDRVLVLDKGEVMEYGSPADLIGDENSAFRALCKAQGEEEFEKLTAMVRT